jgi:lipopolysaccharide export system permease protein
MGKTLRRYLARELALAFLAGLALSTFVLAVMRIMELVDLAFARGVPASRVAALFGYMLPSYLEITLPMAFLLSIVVAFGRLTRDGEIVALYGSGLNLRQIALPIFTFAIGVGALALALAVFTRPWASRQIDATISEMARTRFTSALRPGVFSSWLDGVVIYVGAIEPTTGALTWVMLADDREPARRQTIFATEGSLKTDDVREVAYLHMLDGTILRSLASADSYDKTDFGSFDLTLEFDPQVDDHAEPGTIPPRQLPLEDLLALRAERLAATGLALEEDIELQRKIVVPAGTLLLPLLAIPLGVQRSRAVRSRAMLVSVSAILVYYLLLTVAVTAAREQTLGPVLAMWLPNLAMAAFGSFLFGRAMRDRPLWSGFFTRARAAR